VTEVEHDDLDGCAVDLTADPADDETAFLLAIFPPDLDVEEQRKRWTP
jgi:hypothetical protein